MQDEKPKIIDHLDALAVEILRTRDDAMKARSLDGCERRMRIDQETYDASIDDEENSGQTVTDYAAGKVSQRPQNKAQGSRVVVNIVRGRTEVNVGRLASAAMPTDDRSWGLEVTPDPDLDEQLIDLRPTSQAAGVAIPGPDGQEASVRDIAFSNREENEKRMNGMQTRIDDQLSECDAHGEFLSVIETSGRLGTGVVKGPFVMPDVESKWEKIEDESGTAWQQVLKEHLKPVLKAVDPGDCYPCPGWDGRNADTLSYHWEKGEIVPSKLRQIRNAEVEAGYIKSQIDKVLSAPPIRTRVTLDDGRRVVERNEIDRGMSYETWEYHGDVTKEMIESMGKPVSDNYVSQRACVLFANDIPIKLTLYPMDNQPIIYHYFRWSDIAGSPFGQGIPRFGRWAQLVIQSAFRAMLDNANNVTGGHLVINGEKINKVEKQGSITVWQVPNDVDARNAMAFHQVASNQVTYQAIIELALRFFDLETTTPMAFQGDKVTMPETLGATNILVDAGNVAIENRLTRWEKVLRQIIRAFYDYNMMDPDCPNEIKGDFNCVVSGVKKLQNRELEAKMVQNLMALLQDPDLKFKYDKGKLADRIFQMYRLDIRRPEADIKADEQKAAQQPGPQDPRIEGIKIKAQGDMEIEKLKQQSGMAEIQAKGQEAERQREHERWEKQIEWQMKQAELMAAQQKTLDEIKAKLAVDGERINLQRELSKPGSGGQALTPPTEPGGRASEGKAYQQ
jgi:hypothetical protein